MFRIFAKLFNINHDNIAGEFFDILKFILIFCLQSYGMIRRFKIFKRAFSKIKLFLRKKFSFNAIDAIKFFAHAIFTYIVLVLGIYLPLKITYIGNGHNFSSTQDYYLYGSAFLLLVFIYIRERFVTRSKDKRINADRIIKGAITSTLTLLFEVDLKRMKNDKIELFLNKILTHIERTTEAILSRIAFSNGNLSSNIMLPNIGNDNLVISYIGSINDGRSTKGFSLPIDDTNPLWGAPETFISKKVQYISDISKMENYKRYFRNVNEKVESFVSLPILDKNNKIIAVLNIDSDCKDNFFSPDFVKNILHIDLKVYLILLSIFLNKIK